MICEADKTAPEEDRYYPDATPLSYCVQCGHHKPLYEFFKDQDTMCVGCAESGEDEYFEYLESIGEWIQNPLDKKRRCAECQQFKIVASEIHDDRDLLCISCYTSYTETIGLKIKELTGNDVIYDRGLFEFGDKMDPMYDSGGNAMDPGVGTGSGPSEMINRLQLLDLNDK